MTALVRAGGLAGYCDFTRSIGLDPIDILAQVDLTIDDIADPNIYIPYPNLLEAIELPATKYGIKDFGLRFAKYQDIEFLGALAVAITNVDSAYASLQLTSKYLNFHTPGASLSLTVSADGKELISSFNMHVEPISHPTQVIERSVSYLLRLTNHFAPLPLKPLAVGFSHAPQSPLSVYQKHFGITPEFGTTYNGIIHNLAECQQKGAAPNHDLRELAEQFLQSHFTASQTTSDKALAILRRLMPFRPMTLDELSQTLNMHKRALQRQLKIEGHSFGQLRDQVRRELARNYLAQSQIPLSQVADLLGYSDQAVLTRACHKWFGRTPQNARNNFAKPGQRQITI